MKSGKPKKEGTVDISDLVGNYTVEEISGVIKELGKRIKKAKNGK